MMFIQLQLSTQTGARRTRPSPVQLPTPHSMTVHDHQEVPSPTYTPDAGSNGIPYNLHQFRSFPESEKVTSAHGALRNVKTKIIIRFSLSPLFERVLCYLQSKVHWVNTKGKHVFLLSEMQEHGMMNQTFLSTKPKLLTYDPQLKMQTPLTTSSSCYCCFSLFLFVYCWGVFTSTDQLIPRTGYSQVPAPVVSSSSPRVPCFVRHHGAGHCLRHSTKPSIGLTSS